MFCKHAVLLTHLYMSCCKELQYPSILARILARIFWLQWMVIYQLVEFMASCVVFYQDGIFMKQSQVSLTAFLWPHAHVAQFQMHAVHMGDSTV